MDDLLTRIRMHEGEFPKEAEERIIYQPCPHATRSTPTNPLQECKNEDCNRRFHMDSKVYCGVALVKGY